MIKQQPPRSESSVSIGTVMGDIRDSVIAGRDVILNVILGDESEAVRRQQDRDDLLDMVETLWIEGVLEASLRGNAPVDLTLHERSGAGLRAMNLPRFGPETDNAPNTASASQVYDLFDRARGRLLILGEPGAGKTTLLLLLAQQLLAQARDDHQAQMPVVASLSSWKAGQPLEDWLAVEMNNLYQTARRTARRWLENEQLILLLDGLDEVPAQHRPSCIAALNAFMAESRAPLVVSSRSDAALEIAGQLRLDTSISVQNLSYSQVDAYLVETGQPLAGLRAALQQDADLRELAGTPLMLYVLDTVYRGQPAENIHAAGDARQRRDHLWEAYIQRMFARRPAAARFAPPETIHWLSRLAQMMNAQGARLLLLERVQPSWLQPAWVRVLYLLLSRLLLASLFLRQAGSFGQSWVRVVLPLGLMWAGVDAFFFFVVRGRGPRWLRFSAHLASLIAVLVVFFYPLAQLPQVDEGPLMAVVVALVFAFVTALMLGRRHSADDDIRMNERLTWSWRRAARGGLWGALLGWVLITALTFTLDRQGVWSAWYIRVVIIAVVGLLVGLVIMPFFALHQGAIEARQKAGEGAWLTLRNLVFASVLVGGVGFAVFFLIQAYTTFLSFGPQYVVPSAFAFGFPFWLLITNVSLFFFGGTDLVKYWVLRLMLAVFRKVPWGWVAFLNHASDLIFLRKVGGSYMFLHRELQAYLAGLPAAQPANPAPRVEQPSIRQIGARLAPLRHAVRPRRLAAGLLDLHWHWLAVVFFAAIYLGLTAYFRMDGTQRQLQIVHALEAAQAASNRGEYPQAAASAEQAIALDPGSAHAHYMRGAAYLWWGRSLLQSDPSLAQQYLQQAGQEAQYTIDSGLVLPDGLGKSSQAQLYLLRGKARLYLGDRAAGLQDMLTAHQLGPGNRYVANNLCWTGSLLGAAEQVRAACEALVAAEPNNGSYRDSRGIMRAMTGDLDGALEDFNHYLDWAQQQGYEPVYLETRATWVAALQEGQNPFTPEWVDWLLLW